MYIKKKTSTAANNSHNFLSPPLLFLLQPSPLLLVLVQLRLLHRLHGGGLGGLLTGHCPIGNGLGGLRLHFRFATFGLFSAILLSGRPLRYILKKNLHSEK